MVPFSHLGKDVHIARSPLRSYLPRLLLTLTCMGSGGICARFLDVILGTWFADSLWVLQYR